MRFYRPRSFFTLLLTGFVFVSLPLFTALFSSVKMLDELVEQSAVAVFRSVDRVSDSRKVAAILIDQERNARQYKVLEESSLLVEVNNSLSELTEVVQGLTDLSMGEDQFVELANRLLTLDTNLVRALNRAVTSDSEQILREREKAFARYHELDRLAKELEKTSNQLMVAEVQGLKERVSKDKETMLWQTSGLIGFSVLFLIVFVILISKPVRQMDKGIERLGDGDFITPIQVSGPRDLEILGGKLDWLRKRLSELDREKIKLVAHISHELKTPLASIKEGAGLLRDELVGPMNSSQKEVVAILDKNCSKLQNLIQNILDFNMAQARKVPSDQKNIRLDGLVEEVVADHKTSILAREIQLDVKLIAAKVDGDRQQLKTVFDNLLSNAVKFTPDRGTISIRLKTDGNHALCLVKDSGPGIKEEERAQVFSPFFQGKESKKAVVKGSGLGLAISREYVQAHGGNIRLLPSTQGASFAVSLPLSG
ncbi:MAG: HAMP domain-containing histidine kinase [Deltaproteobacteria bacterium]|nr:HAMP domain-containing histidine kinase [Deltaproteobacteria bacterium]